MAQYSVGFQVSQAVRNNVVAPLFEIQPSATDYPLITEIEIYCLNVSADTVSIGIGTSSTVGVLKATSIIPAQYIPANFPSTTLTIGTEWSTLPGVPTKYYRRGIIATATNLTKLDFVFSSGLKLVPTTSLSVWLTSSSATPVTPMIFDVNLEFDV
ncbi:MAG: hypothetical protein ACXV2C_00245 [Candidatus Bathyarchaeia archaeon]